MQVCFYYPQLGEITGNENSSNFEFRAMEQLIVVAMILFIFFAFAI